MSDHITPVGSAAPAVSLRGLSVVFRDRKLLGRSTAFTAVDGVDLDLAPGEVVGLVGESGSGKTTLGRALLGLVPIAAGSITVDGADLAELGTPLPKSYRRRVQAVFQDPLQALNPRHTVEQIVGEPLRVHMDLSGQALRERTTDMLAKVGLGEQHLTKRTSQLSGGQRQRVAIARALALSPGVLVLDEAVSALDVTTTAQILRLMEEIRPEHAAVLFIAHDLALVRGVCDRVAVMYRGRIVEVGDADAVCGAPQHPYTQLLVASIPHPHPVTQARHRMARDEHIHVSSVETTEHGCPFAARCSHADARCSTFPDFATIDGRSVACHWLQSPPDTGEEVSAR